MTSPAKPDATKRLRRFWAWVAVAGGVAVAALAVVMMISAGTGAGAGGAKKLVPARIGEPVQIITMDGVAVADLTVTDVTVDPTCTGVEPRPEGKHTLLLRVTLQTHVLPDNAADVSVAGLVNAARYQTRGADAATYAASSGSCVAAPPSGFAYAPDSRYDLLVELQVDEVPVALLLPLEGATVPGWEWQVRR